ncbi:MAG: type II toxin-antitoxin system RelE/ParE family toxin [Rubrivivax sp.]
MKKPALLRPQALRDQQHEARYYRHEGGSRLALRMVKASNAALDRIEIEPGLGSPALGRRIAIPGLRAWPVDKFPLLWFYFEHEDHLDVVRLLGARQDLEGILGSSLKSA